VTIRTCVYFDNERREEHIHPETLHPDKTAPMLTLAGPETVEGVSEGWDMKTIPDQDSFTVDLDYSRTRA
jgi:hypothetical protein